MRLATHDGIMRARWVLGYAGVGSHQCEGDYVGATMHVRWNGMCDRYGGRFDCARGDVVVAMVTRLLMLVFNMNQLPTTFVRSRHAMTQ